MRDLATLHGARFAVLQMPDPAEPRADQPIALEHEGHWFVADPITRDAAIAQITEGFETMVLPPADGQPAAPELETQVMARLAVALNQRQLLSPASMARLRR